MIYLPFWSRNMERNFKVLEKVRKSICGKVTLHYAKIFASLKIKNGISLTPLNCALNAFTFALNDSAEAFPESGRLRSLKKVEHDLSRNRSLTQYIGFVTFLRPSAPVTEVLNTETHAFTTDPLSAQKAVFLCRILEWR